MKGRPLLIGLAGAGALASAAVLSGCGGTARVDSGGFTAQDVKAGRAALALLGQTAVWTAASEVTGTNGNLPTSCSFHIAQRKPLTFELFITWAPDAAAGPAPNRRYAWIDAKIGPDGLRANHPFHLGYAPTAKELASHFGNVYAKPAEKCLIEQTGTFAMLPADSKGPA